MFLAAFRVWKETGRKSITPMYHGWAIGGYIPHNIHNRVFVDMPFPMSQNAKSNAPSLPKYGGPVPLPSPMYPL
jgi:hypothetical protein